MLLAQKSKPVALGRKRKKHELAQFHIKGDERMEFEEEKKDKDDGESAKVDHSVQ